MNPDHPHKEKLALGAALALIFVTRLPFLGPGFGSEEDAWGLFYIARKVATTGVYEVSRLPGHPLQEFIYMLLWPWGAPAFNTLTALLSTAAAGFFMCALRNLRVPNYLVAGIVFSFVPVVYINSCNAMDYMWAMAFLMAAFYGVTEGKPATAGILVGLATACRITSPAMLIPFAVLLSSGDRPQSMRRWLRMAVPAAVVSFLFYLPAIMAHGAAFFGYTAQVPSPIPKSLFNATLGVWGLIGFTDLVLVVFILLKIRKKDSGEIRFAPRRIRLAAWWAFLVFGLAYVALPQKAAFLIPALPFAIILLAYGLPRKYLVAFSFSMIFSSFFLGVNLDDPDRGIPGSSWSYSFSLADKPLNLDVLRGPVIAEKVKRANKIAFSNRAIEAIGRLNSGERAIVIAGFWSSDILAQADSLPERVRLVYYVPEDSLRAYKRDGMQIYFLPEQETYNDRAFESQFTERYARPLRVR